MIPISSAIYQIWYLLVINIHIENVNICGQYNYSRMKNIRRRRLLGYVGTLSAVTAAGCLGGSEAENVFGDDPDVEIPEFEVNEDAPSRLMLLTGKIDESELVYQDEFNARVAVANVGGQPIEEGSEMTVRVTRQGGTESDEPQTRTTIIDGLDSGETAVVTAGPFEATAAGTWSIEPAAGIDRTHSDFDINTTVSARTAQHGESVELDNGLRLTGTETLYEQAMFYTTTESRSLFSRAERTVLQTTLDDQILAILKFRVENVGSDELTFGSVGFGSSATAIDESQYNTSPNNHLSNLPDAPITGSPLTDVSVSPGESRAAWLVVPAKRSDTGEIAFEYSVSEATADTPDIVFDMGDESVDLPAFELVETDIPSERKEGEQEFGVIVRNVGNVSGTFRGVVQFESSGDWYHLSRPLEADLEPDEQTRVYSTSDVDPGTVYDYRIQPFGHEFTL